MNEKLESKESIIQKLKKWYINFDLYKKYKVETSNWFYMHFFAKSFLIMVAVFMSLVFNAVSWLPCVIVCMVVISEKTINRFYYLVFIIPLVFVFDLITVPVVVVLFLWGLKYIKDLLLKNKKLNFVKIVLFVFPLIYILLPIGESNFTTCLIFFEMIALFYFGSEYSEEIDIKKVIMSFVLSVVLGAIVGLIGCFSTSLYGFSVYINVGNLYYRFKAIYSDPNFFGTFLIIALNGINMLYLRGDLKLSYYILFPFLLILSIFTYSKMVFFLVVFSLLFEIVYLFCNFKDNKRWIKVGFVLGIVLVIFAVFNKNIGFLFDRFDLWEISNTTITPDSSTPVAPSNPNSGMEDGGSYSQSMGVLPIFDDFLHSKVGKLLTSISSFRIILWLSYVSYLLLDPVRFLFGCGEGAPLLSINVDGMLFSDTHNTFLQLLYLLGMVFFVFLICVLIVWFMKKRKSFKFNIYSVPLIICVFACLFSLSFLTILCFFLIVFLSLKSMFIDKRNQ